MTRDYKGYIAALILGFSVIWIISCSGRPNNTATAAVEVKAPNVEEKSTVTLISIDAPKENSIYKLGEVISVIIKQKRENQTPDSILIYYDGKRLSALHSEPWSYSIPNESIDKTGRKALKVVAYRDGKAQTTITRFVTIVSDRVPTQYGFRVVNTYNHDRESFTQGLFFDGGYLYEGTGEEGKSCLRKVDIATGSALKQTNLSPELFGEGITLYDGRIYQVTWISKVGFVYDKETFSLINKIYYQTEGWGLTTLDDKIVMSDGTNNLYFFDPNSFSQVSKIEVYDDKKMVDQLNELEYINGEVWANVWNTDLIARIDPATGRVNGYVNLQNLITGTDTDTSIDVLNGIAYDEENDRIFVTGKNWPKLFEIQVIKK